MSWLVPVFCCCQYVRDFGRERTAILPVWNRSKHSLIHCVNTLERCIAIIPSIKLSKRKDYSPCSRNDNMFLIARVIGLENDV